MSGPALDFDAHLSREIVESERLRMAILAVLFALIAALTVVFTIAFRDAPVPFLRNADTLRMILGIMGGLVAYELLLRALIGHRIQRGATPPAAWKLT